MSIYKDQIDAPSYKAANVSPMRAMLNSAVAVNDDAPLADQKAVVEAVIARLDDDQAAWHTEEFVSALADVYANDRQDYKRYYYRLKKWGIAVDVERSVKIFSRKQKKLKNAALPTLSTLPGLAEDFIQHPNSTKSPETAPNIAEGALLAEPDDDGKAVLAIESEGAVIIAGALRGFAAYNQDAKTWHLFMKTHWQVCETEAIDSVLIGLLYKGSSPLGFKNCYKNAVRAIIEAGNFVPLPAPPKHLLPFKNGLLDCQTKQLIPTTANNAHTWCLPYAYNQQADCPTIKAWLKTTVDGDHESVELLRAWLAALLHGRADLQKYLHLFGSGGTGKGVFTRLATALIGEQNTVATTLERMERSQFETARFYGKRLVLINDSDKYGGGLETFKNLTGQDRLRLERKHQQATGGFIFGGLVLMASNDHIVSTDNSSGIDRRRIVVVFNRRATDAEKVDWHTKGGEKQVIHAELPGLVNWALELSQDDISRIIRTPPDRTKQANFEAMKANNPIAAWLHECCVPDTGAWTQIGDKREIRNQGAETVFEGADNKLYPNYLQWSQRRGHSPLLQRRFKSTVVETCETLGVHVYENRRKSGAGIAGIRLVKEWEAAVNFWNP